MIKKEEEIFGFFFLVDGATFSNFPLLNITAFAKNILVAVIEKIYCQDYLASGN